LVYNVFKKQTIFTITHKLEIFGFHGDSLPTKEEICVRVKSLFTLLQLTGNTNDDFAA